MVSKRVVLAMIAVIATMVMVSPSFAVDSDAKTIEVEDYSYQVLGVYYREVTSPSTVSYGSYNICYFEAGSDNEKLFLNYIENGGSMPNDDKKSISKGDTIHLYAGSSNTYWEKTDFYVTFDNIDSYSLEFERFKEKPSLEFYFEAGAEYSAVVTWSNKNVTFRFANESISSGVMNYGIMDYSGSKELYGYSSSFADMWIDISYTIDGVKDPNGVGEGANIIGAILLVLSCIVFGTVIYLYKGPKWAK